MGEGERGKSAGVGREVRDGNGTGTGVPPAGCQAAPPCPSRPAHTAARLHLRALERAQNADGRVPLYDRAPAKVRLVGQKRSAAALGEAGWPSPGAVAPPSSDAPRCFNCGSYGHSLKECWRALDHEAVAAARASRSVPCKGGKVTPGRRSTCLCLRLDHAPRHRPVSVPLAAGGPARGR